MKNIYILYVSTGGNIDSFVNRLSDHAEEMHQQSSTNPLIVAKEINQIGLGSTADHPFFALIPNHLDGNSETVDIMQDVLGKYLAFDSNYTQCIGIIGSDTENLSHPNILTAKRYSEIFSIPFLLDYELCITAQGIQTLYETLKDTNL